MKTENILSLAAGAVLGYFIFKPKASAIGFTSSDINFFDAAELGPQYAGAYYKTIHIEEGKKKYAITERTGKYGYAITVRDMKSPHATLGKDFKSWDEAVSSYKSPLMKTMLLLAEEKLSR